MRDKKHGGTSLDAELDDYWKNKEDDDPTDKGKFCNSCSVLLSRYISEMFVFSIFAFTNRLYFRRKYLLLRFNCFFFLTYWKPFGLISFSCPFKQMTGSC